ncbi:ubiquitin-like-specific protease 1A [Vigna radiata var. radiata]|uniref:Ubiquitin-like-specific protease 1A n=1 Tax=Vigna radiata var. radiata TaxID=3916 RepID=A0A1S3V054_VIGRR|nr:ubiquitin-like-specific protease 1A [Vigna radiata var. radiata]
MEGASTDDKGRDLVIANFVDGGIHAPSTNENIDFSIVYKTCTSMLCDDGAVVLVEVSNNMLTCTDLQCLKPRAKIDNMVMLFATGMIVYNELHIAGMISRCFFNPFFATMVMERLKIPKKKREPLTQTDYHHWFQPQSFALNVLLRAQFLFVPSVGDDHWWCYAVNCQSRELFILDPLGHKRRSRKKIDKAIVATLQELFNMIDIDSNYKEQELNVIEEDLPVQPNTYDCGMLVIKYMELWDHTPKFDGNKIPDYTTDQLQVLRKQMVCEWTLHKDNVHRSLVLKKCGMAD